MVPVPESVLSYKIFINLRGQFTLNKLMLERLLLKYAVRIRARAILASL
jgi:hypothetical protein